MTEAEARDWIAAHHGVAGRDVMERLIALVVAEAASQNLVAPSTLEAMWSRHVVDSAQLLLLADGAAGPWIDIGSGAGFPGLVVAALSDRPVILVEPRKRRAAFLRDAVAHLACNQVDVVCDRIQTVTPRAAVISARAVAPLANLLDWATGCSAPSTRWLLPKGRSAREEVESAARAWHGVFHVERSITDPDSMIVVASGVRRR